MTHPRVSKPHSGIAHSNVVLDRFETGCSRRGDFGADLAEADAQELAPLLLRLCNRLQGCYPHADPGLVWDAVADALLDQVRRQVDLNNNRGADLEANLVSSARRNLSNRLRADQRRRNRELAWVELCATNRTEPRPDSAAPPWDGSCDPETMRAALLYLLADPVDQALFKLWWDGERSLEPFAQLLRLTGRTETQQRQRIKRHKDRVLKWLQRKWGPEITPPRPDATPAGPRKAQGVFNPDSSCPAVGADVRRRCGKW